MSISAQVAGSGVADPPPAGEKAHELELFEVEVMQSVWIRPDKMPVLPAVRRINDQIGDEPGQFAAVASAGLLQVGKLQAERGELQLGRIDQLGRIGLRGPARLARRLGPKNPGRPGIAVHNVGEGPERRGVLVGVFRRRRHTAAEEGHAGVGDGLVRVEAEGPMVGVGRVAQFPIGVDRDVEGQIAPRVVDRNVAKIVDAVAVRGQSRAWIRHRQCKVVNRRMSRARERQGGQDGPDRNNLFHGTPY